tara:strand:- start:29 stop:355 length:327 start_codon:yes stop_codon:yes gene_type:complete
MLYLEIQNSETFGDLFRGKYIWSKQYSGQYSWAGLNVVFKLLDGRYQDFSYVLDRGDIVQLYREITLDEVRSEYGSIEELEKLTELHKVPSDPLSPTNETRFIIDNQI